MIVTEKEAVQSVLRIHSNDNVLVALRDLPAKTSILFEDMEITVQQDIPSKHKFFISDLSAGQEVRMYGALVGKVECAVSKGDLMTTQNTKHAAGAYGYRGFNCKWQQPDVSKYKARSFNGYHRNDGRIGTANYWLFIPMVFCENRNLDIIKEALQKELGYSTNEKYSDFTRQLLNAHKAGFDSELIDLLPASATERYFKNIAELYNFFKNKDQVT